MRSLAESNLTTLEVVYDLTIAVGSIADPVEATAWLAEQAAAAVGGDASALYVLNAATGRLHLRQSSGVPLPGLATSVAPGEVLAGQTFARGKPIVVERGTRAEDLEPGRLPAGADAAIAVPLRFSDFVSGVLIVFYAHPPRSIPRRLLHAVGLLAAQLGASLRAVAAQESELEATATRGFRTSTSRLLANALDLETTLERVGQLAVPQLADWCTIDMLAPDGTIDWLALVHGDPEKVALERALLGRDPPDPSAAMAVEAVLRMGEAMQYQTAATLGPHSALIMPLRANGKLLGALSLKRIGVDRPYSASERAELAEHLATRCSQALGNTQVYHAAQEEIAERRRTELALRESQERTAANEERFRKQYKGFPLPTYSWLQVGDDLVLQDFNDAAEVVTGGQIASALGAVAAVFYSDTPDILSDLRVCLTEHRTFRREMRYRYRTTGVERDLALSYVFVPPQTVMVHSEDITEARRAEQQREVMAQSEKLRALGQMATGIAHDLNQSLMLVASYSDLARRAVLEDPPNLLELDDLLTTTTQAALDGGETVKRLLLFTRAAPELNSKRVDLSSVVRDAAQLTAPRWRDAAQAEGRPISLHIEAAGHPMIQGSPAQLRELMTNLIFNAVDALPTGGVIRLRVVAEDGQGIVEVADSGVGMSTEVQARVFEPFFTTKGEGGTGLGLAMVFGIVDQHGGRIEVNSAPGNGTTFRTTFPLVDTSLTAEPSPTSAVAVGALAPLRILAVDDEPMMTKAVVRMLKPSGHVVSVAGSGEEALEVMGERTFDVVVSDMGMGAGMNGWELAAAVRRRWPNVRFLLATGWGAAIDPHEARAKGVEAVLAKPYQLADLLSVLSGIDRAA